tara:strand:- start:13 stop:561 length:549 start_codon:yes stop_codon:yes gene_type:complete
MNIQTRRKIGSPLLFNETLEVQTDYSETGDPFLVTHSIELIDGPSITHGGGAKAGAFLHYIAADIDEDCSGNTDYALFEMVVKQEAEGVSRFKILADVVSVEAQNAFLVLLEEWKLAIEAAGIPTLPPQEETYTQEQINTHTSNMAAFEETYTGVPMPMQPTPVRITSDVITIEWSGEDTFV